MYKNQYRIYHQLCSIKRFYYSLFLGLLALFFVTCSSTKEAKAESTEAYLPSIINNIKLGMTMNQVLVLRDKAYVVNAVQETPRHVYTEDFDSPAYNSIYYFFSKVDQKQLVEINIYHASKEAAEKTINQYFGEKASKQNQWHKRLKDGSEIHATWRKQKVFIFVDVPGERNNKTEKTAEE